MNTLRMMPLVLAATIACGGSSSLTTPTGSNPPAGSAAVAIEDFSFVPASLTIKAGTTVRWSNRGPSAHTSTSDTGIWDSGNLAGPGGGGGYGNNPTPGGTFDFTFTQTGTFSYHCTLHPPSSYPNFTGMITVTP